VLKLDALRRTAGVARDCAALASGSADALAEASPIRTDRRDGGLPWFMTAPQFIFFALAAFQRWKVKPFPITTE